MVSLSSVLGPLCSWYIYINDQNHAVKFCKVHHFAYDTNLLHFSKLLNKLNKCINLDMKNLTDWLNANRISLNVKENWTSNFQAQEKGTRMPNKNLA